MNLSNSFGFGNGLGTSGTVSSVGLAMPSPTTPAFTVSNSPVTGSGTLTVTANGSISQYVRGDGSLASFPSLTGYVPYTGATKDLNLGSNNLYVNNVFSGFTSVAASATLITLTVNSTPYYLVTGSGGQTIKLPDATTLPKGALFNFNNNQSSGAILVNNNSNTLVKSVPSGGSVIIELIDNSTAAGSWDSHSQAPSNVSWSTNTFDYAGSITSATWNGVNVALNRGGTGANTAAGARTNLGSTTVGDNFFTLTNPSAITFPQINANNTVSALSASDFRTAIGASGIITLSAIGSSPNANAATLTSTVLNLEPASASFGGVVTTGNQTFAGAKTFNGSITATANGHRFGNFEILTSGNAVTTGQGITVTGVDRTVQFQGASNAAAQDMFLFRSSGGTTNTAQLISTSFSVIRVYGGFSNPNIDSLSGNTLWLSPTYNITDAARTGTIVRGVYYAPTLTSLTNTTHRAWENTTGDILLGTTSGSVSIGATTSINASAILQITSTTKGVLFPRMTTAQKTAISTPPSGLVVYDTDLGKLCVRGAINWETITSV